MKAHYLVGLLVAAILLGALPGSGSAQSFVLPARQTFAPSGTMAVPWSLLNSAAGASAGGQVRIIGGQTVFGSHRIDRPSKLTRSSLDGTVKIGAAPLAQTNFRAICYNVWLGSPATGAANWAMNDRANAIRNYNWGDWDAIGLCEVWNTGTYYNHLRFLPGVAAAWNGFDLAGSFQHSGLVAFSRHPIFEVTPRGEFSVGAGADWFASKGWIRARVSKGGFGVWVFMTHANADDGITWSEIYSTRVTQFNEIANDIRSIRDSAGRENDVFLLMGDLNVFGENRSPGGPTFVNEYNRLATIFEQFNAMDLGRQFHPNAANLGEDAHTFSRNNTLTQYHYPGTTVEGSARLDYIIAISSKSGKVIMEPTKYEVIRPMAPTAFTDDGHTDRNLSDHYAVGADFRIMRIAN
jgi:hypothetical protein